MSFEVLTFILSLLGGIAIAVKWIDSYGKKKQLQGILDNDIKHIKGEIGDIKNWIEKKSPFIDEIQDRIIAVEKDIEYLRKNGR